MHQISTTTDMDGNFTFAGLATGGQYTITPTRTFYTFTDDDGGSSATFITPVDDQRADFLGARDRYNIQGHLSNARENALGEVKVTLTGGPAGAEPVSIVTDTEGDYAFTVDAGYNYSLSVSRPGYVFDPPNVFFGVVIQDMLADFVGRPQPVLLTQGADNRAVALNSITLVPEPF